MKVGVLFSNLVVGLAMFQIGLHIGLRNGGANAEEKCQSSATLPQQQRNTASIGGETKCPTREIAGTSTANQNAKYIAGESLLDAQQFSHEFDAGLPPLEGDIKNLKTLVVHLDPTSLPTNVSKDDAASVSVEQAMENCHVTQVMYYSPPSGGRDKNRCLALVPQIDAFHVYNFMRMVPDSELVAGRLGNGGKPTGKPKIRHDLPHRLVSRTHITTGTYTTPPALRQTKQYWSDMAGYYANLPKQLERLEPIAKAAAANTVVSSGGGVNNIINENQNNHSNNKALVIATVNQGQSELLANWVCHNRARNLPTDQMLVFATDSATADMAQNLGLHVFDVQDAFGITMPTGAATRYGDRTFRALMMAKVYCVHMTMLLGYDVLFQDVDIVWYQNPLEYFANNQGLKAWDAIFQDDGARSRRFAPYMPNSGLYYLRNNERTMAFINEVARRGDIIEAMQSHQTVFASTLAEYSSWRGLRVKVMGRKTEDGRSFPCGFHYHRDKELMRGICQTKTAQPVLFHMSWTNDKKNKRKFMEQMGQWHIKEECVAAIAAKKNGAASDTISLSNCCSATALFKCHYADKPSIQSCSESPKMDGERARSFW